MRNMAYCRFENTFSDLEDCFEHILDGNLSESESKYRNKLIRLCFDLYNEVENKIIEEKFSFEDE